MRRLAAACSLAVVLTLGSAMAVFAAPPAKDCPNQASGFAAIHVDDWWALTVDGLTAEGLTPDAAAALFGFATAAELRDAVEQGIRGLDRNGDGYVCWKPFPEHGNQPDYFFNAVDTNARA